MSYDLLNAHLNSSYESYLSATKSNGKKKQKKGENLKGKSVAVNTTKKSGKRKLSAVGKIYSSNICTLYLYHRFEI